MRKKAFSRSVIKSVITYALVAIATFGSIQLLFNENMFFVPKFYSIFTKKGVTPVMNDNEQYLDNLRKIVAKSFDTYASKCMNSDGINLLNFQCTKDFGFSATLLESLEVLYLLGLNDQYNRAHMYLKTQFRCSKLEWINRREFWTRGIGSLIGAYTLSHDDLFLTRADECFTEINRFGNNFAPYLNIKTGESRSRKLSNTIYLSDYSVGIPEMIALFKFTKNEKYMQAIKTRSSKFPNLYPSYFNEYDRYGNEPINYDDSLTNKNIPFIYEIILANKLYSYRKFASIIENLTLTSSFYIDDLSISQILEIDDLKEDFINNSKEYLNNIMNAYEPPFDILRSGKPNDMTPFSFDSPGLRSMYKRGFASKVRDAVSGIISNCFTGIGISSIGKTSQNRPHPFERQPSSFFGELALIGAIAATKTPNFNKALFNSRGHILRL